MAAATALVSVSAGVDGQDVQFGSPAVVAPGTISNGNAWRGAFAPSGDELYFFRRVTPLAEDYRIYVSRRSSGEWGDPQPVSFSGSTSDLYPAISPGGDRMILTSYRPVPGVPANAHLFESRREQGGWSEPRYVPELNQPGAYYAQPYFTRDSTLHFRRVGPEGPTTWDASLEGERFSRPRAFDLEVAFGAPGLEIRGAFLSPDQCLAVLTVEVRRGNVDLYWSRRTGQEWSIPMSLGPDINSEGMDLFPFFSPDGETLHFVRDFSEILASRVRGHGCH